MLAIAADTGSDNRSIEHICTMLIKTSICYKVPIQVPSWVPGWPCGSPRFRAFVFHQRARALAENDAHPDSLQWDQPGGTATGRDNGETQRGDTTGRHTNLEPDLEPEWAPCNILKF